MPILKVEVQSLRNERSAGISAALLAVEGDAGQNRQDDPDLRWQGLNGWKASVKGTMNAADITKAWTVKDGAMASLGEGRGVLHTDKANTATTGSSSICGTLADRRRIIGLAF